MNNVNYLLLYKGDSDKGGPETSVRCFVELDAAMKAMHDHHRKLASALGIPFDPRTSSGPYTVWTKNGIRMDRHGDHFQWEIIKAVPEDAAPDVAAQASDGAVLRVTGDRNIPLMAALLNLYVEQPEVLNGLVEVIPSDGYPLCFSEVRQFRPQYLKALNDISQLLQDNGYEAASKFLDCSFEL